MWMKRLFFMLIVRPLLLLVSGIRADGLRNLPKDGPAILVANHNSHLDTLAIMSLFPVSLLPKIRPVAARDYFFGSPLRRFVSEKLIGIIPLDRRGIQKSGKTHPLQPMLDALDRGEILIIFPEGSRGEPGKMKPFKSGFAHLAKMRPDVPVVPVKIGGTDRSLPKEEALWVPFILDIDIATPYHYGNDIRDFIQTIERCFHADR